MLQIPKLAGTNDLILSMWCSWKHDITGKRCSSVCWGGGGVGVWGAATLQNKAVKSSTLGTFLQLRGPEGRIFTKGRRIAAIGEEISEYRCFCFSFPFCCCSQKRSPLWHQCSSNNRTSFFSAPSYPDAGALIAGSMAVSASEPLYQPCVYHGSFRGESETFLILIKYIYTFYEFCAYA